jgi:hypothetical protein
MKIDESKFRFRIGDKVKYKKESYTVLGYCFRNEFNNYNDTYGYLIDKVSYHNSKKVFDEDGYAIEYCLDYAFVKESDISYLTLCERLKYAPKGCMMYSPVFGIVTLKEVGVGEITVLYSGYEYKFNYRGQYILPQGLAFGECLLFPSQNNRDWNTVSYEKPKEEKQDLPVGTFCYVFDNGGFIEKYDGCFRHYAGNSQSFLNAEKEGPTMFWHHIIPVDKMNFKDLSFDPKDDYGNGGD